MEKEVHDPCDILMMDVRGETRSQICTFGAVKFSCLQSTWDCAGDCKLSV